MTARLKRGLSIAVLAAAVAATTETLPASIGTQATLVSDEIGRYGRDMGATVHVCRLRAT